MLSSRIQDDISGSVSDEKQKKHYFKFTMKLPDGIGMGLMTKATSKGLGGDRALLKILDKAKNVFGGFPLIVQKYAE